MATKDMATPKEQLEIYKQGTVDLVSEAELLQKLESSYKEKRPLRIKAGFDPSRPDLHLGHTVLMNKMKQFQDFGHQVIFLIGDFTAMIGDPTGKNQTRPPLTREEVVENSKTYATQVYKILDEAKTEVAFNNDWVGKLEAQDFIKLASQYTVARMLERDDFEKRYKGGQPISVHEFLYPLVQGYDSVALRSDVELGGTDQKFNLLVGRDLQKSYGQTPQCIITVPILEGTDGVNKMSKSLDNYIGVEDSPKDMFGKIMSISDELMFKYWALLTDIKPKELEEKQKHIAEGSLHPKVFKDQLALFLVERFHGKAAADNALQEFQRIFKDGGIPDDIPVIELPANEEIWICKLLHSLGVVSSSSEGRRMIQSSAVEMDGAKITDFQLKVVLKPSVEHLIKVGKKKFVKAKGK
ncbi:MAG: tyrosine--tRNA ligase [Bdellovibrionaceae bacterium]|nr:tyrosine--tRNA ligase [Pseudobdellovibrionaceae bacterium]